MQFTAAFECLETIHVDRGATCTLFNQTDIVKYELGNLFQPILYTHIHAIHQLPLLAHYCTPCCHFGCQKAEDQLISITME